MKTKTMMLKKHGMVLVTLLLSFSITKASVIKNIQISRRVSVFLLLLLLGVFWYIYMNIHPYKLNNTTCQPELQNMRSDIYIALVESSLSRNRSLDLWWDIDVSPFPEDWVGIFRQNPVRDTSRPVFSANVTESSGRIQTNLSLPPVDSGSLGYQKKCLDFWVGYIRGSMTLMSRCFETQPTWMNEMRPYVGKWRLGDLFIPGNHDAGAYNYDPLMYPEWMVNYILTQNVDILSQLIYGIRYLDIRVGYYPDGEKEFWIIHGVKLYPLMHVVEAVKTFLRNTNEIVLFDVQKFSLSFNREAHLKLLRLLKTQFAYVIAPRKYGWSATLDTFWDTGLRLVVGYDHPMALVEEYFWEPVMHMWGNVKSPEALHGYVAQVMEERESDSTPRVWSVMAEMTFSVYGLMTKNFEDLRQAAQLVNRNVSTSFRRRWWREANVVAVDYFLGSDIVSVAIRSNWRRISAVLEKQ